MDRIRVPDLRLNGCRECGGCDATGVCVQQDELREIIPRLDAAGSVIVSTPVFFYSMPAQLKALVDRAQAAWNRRRLEKSVEERQRHDRNLFDGLELTVRYFFDALDKSYEGGVFLREVEGKGDVARRPDALREAYELGRKAAG